MTVQPPDPLSLRASDTDRNAIADILGGAYAEGRLSLTEYHERLDELMRTTTYGELVPFVIDLPDVADKLPVPLRSDAAHPIQEPAAVARTYSSSKSAKGTTVAVLGENKRRGSFTIGASATVVAVLGEAVLDLSHATFASAEVHLTVNAVLGQATVVVPADAIVSVGVVPVLGEVKTPGDSAPLVHSTNAPHITLRGVALLGEVRVERAPAPPRGGLPGAPSTPELGA